MREDAPVANAGDYEGQQHADNYKEDSVVVSIGTIPQAFLALTIKLVSRPAKVVR